MPILCEGYGKVASSRDEGEKGGFGKKQEKRSDDGALGVEKKDYDGVGPGCRK